MTTKQYSQQAAPMRDVACIVAQGSNAWQCIPSERWMRVGYGNTAEQAINDCFVKNN